MGLSRLQGLAAFLKAIGFLIPLMDAEYANYYTREVMLILIREFQSPDEEMKKIVLKVLCMNMPLHDYSLVQPLDYSYTSTWGHSTHMYYLLSTGRQAVLCN